MALRIRRDGRIFCAALRGPEDGDTYVDDELHHRLSAVYCVLVTEPAEQHLVNAEWWWRDAVPDGVSVAKQYL